MPPDGPPKPPSPRAKREATSVASFSPFVVFQDRLVTDHRALVLALVGDRKHGRVRGDVRGRRKRLVKGDVALAVDDHDAVEIHLARPGAPRRDGGKGRHHLQRTRRGAGLVDEGELPLVHGIGAQADAIGVEHHLAIAVAVFLAEVLQRHQLFVFDRHFCLASSRLCSSSPRKRGSSSHRRLLDPRFRGDDQPLLARVCAQSVTPP